MTNNKKTAEAFSRHQFENAFPFLADNILWNIIGGELIKGKENVIEACNKSSTYLNTVTTTFTRFLILESQDYVTIDSISDYIDSDKNFSNVASCDIYKFDTGQLVEIISYCIELHKEK